MGPGVGGDLAAHRGPDGVPETARKGERIMYMSYCRFEGTRNELSACMDKVTERLDEMDDCAVSEREVANFRNMVLEFNNWLHDMELIDDEGYIDEEALDSVCAAIGDDRVR